MISINDIDTNMPFDIDAVKAMFQDMQADCKAQHMQIFVRTITGKTITLHMKLSDTIAKLKDLLTACGSIPREPQVLSFNAMPLEDDQTPLSYCIKNEATIWLNLRFDGGG